jgi:hypothetical protein
VATLEEQLFSALEKADAAGNTDDARALAAEIRRLKTSESGTSQDYGAAVARGTSPYATTAILGGTLGLPFGPPGVAAGAALAPAALGIADLASLAYNKLATPFGASRMPSGSEAINSLLYPNLPETRGTGPQLLQSTLAGATSGYGMAKGAEALSKGMALADQGRTLPRVVNALAVRPGSQAAAGAGAGAGSYVAPQIGQAAGVQDPALLELLGFGGGLVGGVAGGVTPFLLEGTTKIAGRGIQNFAEPFLPGGKDAIRARAFIKAFENNPQEMQRAVQLLRSGLTVEQTAAELGNTGFAALVSSSRRADPRFQTKIDAQEAQATKSQANRVALARRELELTQQGLDQRTAAAQAAAEARAAAQQAAVQARQAELGGQVRAVDPNEVGAVLTAERERLLGTVKPQVTAQYEKAFGLAPDEFSFANVEAAAARLADDPATRLNPDQAPYTYEVMRLYQTTTPPNPNVTSTGRLKPKWQRTSEMPEAQPAMVSLRDADTFLHAVNKDLSALSGKMDSGSNMTRANLMKLKAATERAIEDGVPTEAREAYRGAARMHQIKVVEPFREGWVANLEREGATGTAILAPHKVTNAALDSTDSATRFVRAFGDSDTAKTALRNGIEELYRKTVVNKDTGAIDPKKHADFMDAYGRQITVLDDSGVNIGRTLEQYGTGARRLRTESEVAAEASKGISGRVKQQFAPEQAEIDKVTASANRAASKLADVPPERSIENLKNLTRNLPQIRKTVDDVLAEIRQQKRFEELATSGESAGGNVLGLVSQSTGNPPMSLSTVGSILNFILRRAQGKLNPELAAKIAAETFNASGLANMIEGAPAAAARTGRMGKIGRTLNAPIKKPDFSLTLTGINALAPERNRNNALAEP